MAQSVTLPAEDPRYVIPTIDPKEFDDFAVFRETFLRHLDHVGDGDLDATAHSVAELRIEVRANDARVADRLAR